MDTAHKDEMPVLDRLIELFGTQTALATALRIRSASISGWRLRRKVPADRCNDIERITNGAITRVDLRPDVFGEIEHSGRLPAAADAVSIRGARA